MQKKPKMTAKEAIEAMKQTEDVLEKASHACLWHEMQKQHEHLMCLLQPFEDDMIPGCSDKAEKILADYDFNARILIGTVKKLEQALCDRVNSQRHQSATTSKLDESGNRL